MRTSRKPADRYDEPDDAVVTREIEIVAGIDEVWEALATDTGRDRWLEPDPERELIVELAEPPHRIVWWWWSDDEPARRVDVRVRAISTGVRVVVTETSPAAVPLARLAASFSRELVAA